jgi:hypothetical protein
MCPRVVTRNGIPINFNPATPNTKPKENRIIVGYYFNLMTRISVKYIHGNK